MKHKHRICSLIACSFVATSSLHSEQTAARPNIIVIMADDHAVNAIGAYNPRTPVPTPNIDRLANEGMLFKNMFCVNSVCGPSRANFLSGRHTAQNGFYSNFDEFDGSQPTFPKLLQAAGYETAIIGKWHLNSRPTGFDFFSILPGHGLYFDSPFLGPQEPWRRVEMSEGYLTDVITDKSIEWIKSRDSSKPFCLLIHHKAPHEPHKYPEKYASLLDDRDLPFPPLFNADRAKRGDALENGSGRWCKLEYTHTAWLNETVPSGVEQGTEAYKRWAYQTFFKGYFRLVAALDDSIGRLLDYLDASGLAENTLVAYTSDNGFFLGDFGMFNKMWIYEESMRIPLLMRKPGMIKAGSVSDALVTILDLAPTFVDIANGTVDPGFQGRSLLPLFTTGSAEGWRDAVFYHYHGGFDIPAHRGVRSQRYKLIHFLEMPPVKGALAPLPDSGEGSNMTDGQSWEFYDLQADPMEQRNLYNDPEYAEPRKKMHAILEKLAASYEPRNGGLQ